MNMIQWIYQDYKLPIAMMIIIYRLIPKRLIHALRYQYFTTKSKSELKDVGLDIQVFSY